VHPGSDHVLIGADFTDADIVIRINAEQVGLEEKN
jgi:hypothetical protein